MATPCGVCRDLQLAPGKYSYDFPERRGPRLHEIKTAAQRGCSGCAILYEGVQHCFEGLGVDHTERLCTFTIIRGTPPRLIAALYINTDEGREGEPREIEFFQLPGTTGPLSQWNGIGPANIVPSTRFSRPSLARVREWLKTCTEQHELCRKMTRDRPRLPTRVLEIGLSIDPSDALSVRLREMRDGETGRYICLSHCWGSMGSQLLKTETKNVELFKQGIPWTSFPPTFRDALRFAAELGVRYVWIDSLCILQDSVADWQNEAAKMADIYQNTFLTLAATAGSDSTFGLDVKTPQYYEAHGLRASVPPGGREPQIYVRNHHPHWCSSPFDMTQLFPLLSRGWVYQERLLSPRVLHFGCQELLWECMSLSDCECTVVPDPSIDRKRWYAEALTHPAPNPGTGTGVALGELWGKIVHDYSKLALTKGEDKLAAIAGCAKQMQRAREPGTRYLAGLWEDTLIPDLLWRALAPSQPRPDRWRAPSWSWAAVDDDVSCEQYTLGHVFAQVVDVDVECRTSATAAEADADARDPAIMPDEGAYLVLTGQRIPARVLAHEQIYAAGMMQSHFSLRIDVGGAGSRTRIDVPAPYFSPDYDFSAPGPDTLDVDEVVWCLRIARVPGRNIEYSLVLRCVDEEEQMYQRIGLVHEPLAGERDSPGNDAPATGHTRIFDTQSLIDALFSFSSDDLGSAGLKEGIPEVEGGWYAGIDYEDIVTIV